MEIRVHSGHSFIEVLAQILPLWNKDTSPVTPALIFRGVTISFDFPLEYLMIQGPNGRSCKPY
ncbi:hypothetical protein Hanom_Chr16g01445041 [Helianthus anomalus]